jgi:endoglucanase
MYVDDKKIFVGMEGNGGWHDGGDYWRSSMSHAQTVSRMLWPLEMFSGKLDLTPSLLFPEEKWDGNTDILSEIKWGLDWLFKLQYNDGGISTGISPIHFQMPPMGTPPQDDPLLHYIGAANSSHTAKAGAVFAKAARLLKRYDDDYAEQCQQKALLCWKYLQKHKEMVNPKTIRVYGRHSDEEDRLWFAVEMYKTIGDIQYHEEFIERYKKLDNPYPKAPVSTQTIRNYNLHEALISYCFIKRGADKKIQSEILEHLIKASDELVSISKSEGYGSVLNDEKLETQAYNR